MKLNIGSSCFLCSALTILLAEAVYQTNQKEGLSTASTATAGSETNHRDVVSYPCDLQNGSSCSLSINRNENTTLEVADGQSQEGLGTSTLQSPKALTARELGELFTTQVASIE